MAHLGALSLISISFPHVTMELQEVHRYVYVCIEIAMKPLILLTAQGAHISSLFIQLLIVLSHPVEALKGQKNMSTQK